VRVVEKLDATARRFAESSPAIVATMREELDIAIAFVDDELTNKRYIVGDDFTGADIMLSVTRLTFRFDKHLLNRKMTFVIPFHDLKLW